MIRRNNSVWLFLLLLSALSWADDAPRAAKKTKFSFQDLLNQAAGPSDASPTVAGVRGLEETGAAVDTKARDFAAIERLEGVVVHDDELQKFIAEGKLR